MIKKRNIFTLIIILFSATLNNSCANPKTIITIVDLAISVVDTINEFTEKNKEFTEKIISVTKTVSKGIEGKKEVTEVAIFWEKYWEQIHNDYVDLTDLFQKVNIKSIDYFNELNKNNAKIRDKNLKFDDNKKNDELKEKWVIEYNRASDNLKQVKTMLSEGDDYKYLLRNEVLRINVNKSILTLDNIANQANILASNVKSFEMNTKNIFMMPLKQ